ncbi:MAG: TonB-dependent receptor [Proteobacteria bacterium]|nr:TonB-dependent receptor [Pseudomonadota bacterium]
MLPPRRSTSAALLGLIPALALASPAHAGEGSGNGEIVVTGRGLADGPAVPAYDVVSLGREAMLRAASGRIEELLGTVAGFQQFRRSDSRSANPSAQGVTLRALGGNAAGRTLVLLDGVPMADPFFGAVPLAALAPDRLAGARVTRGGGNGAFGMGAVAGTIELTSAGPAELGPFSASAMADDRGDAEGSVALAPRLHGGFAVLSGHWEGGPGFWTTPPAQRVAASVPAAYRGWSTGLRLVSRVAPGVELQARGLAFADQRTLRFAGANTSDAGADASLRLVGRGRWGFDALVYGQLRDFANVVVSSTSFRPTLDQYKTPTTGWGGKLELRPPALAGHHPRLGADLRVVSGNEQERALAASGATTALRREGGRNSDLGLYLEDDWQLGALVLTGGARADRWAIAQGRFTQLSPAGAVTTSTAYPDRAGWAASLRGGARLTLGAGLALRATAYSGLRQPTLNELYRSFTVFPVTTQANAALANERLVGSEAGVEWRAGPASLGLTLFADTLRHAVANVTIGPNLKQRQNVDAIRTRGVELSAGLVLGTLSLDTSLALSDARVRASGAAAALNGLRPAQTAPLAASATLGWRPRPGWQAQLSLRHTAAQFEDDLQSDVLPAATTVGALLSAPLGHGLALVLRGENLGNATVYTRNQAGSIDLAAPRTVWIGLRTGGR